MVAVITGDVINSDKIDSKKWLSVLKKYLNTLGKTPADWAIYRGDEFQLRLKNTEDAFVTAIQIKAKMKQFKNLDVRLSIGLGDEIAESKNILESNGTAFVRSGRSFDELRKNKTTMLVNTGNHELDQELNLYIKLALTGFMDKWSIASAEIISLTLENQSTSQEEIARMAGMAQAAVSQRLKRANFEVLMDLNNMFVKKINNLK
ncbi:MAG: hypothetical protein IPM42_20315 [Saprospiraceae bacterium]|nr:hypothetical protein [Saprospiraceae bacterium]